MQDHIPDINVTSELDEGQCWQAVLDRDERLDGAFVYGVSSTLIFCRPSCPSRRPQRERARFFSSVEAAIGAGFRPCRRCRPDQFLSVQVTRVQQACHLIEKNADTALSLEELSREVGGSPYHLQRTFKQVTGISPQEYADALRLGQLRKNLQEGESVLNALYEAGYGSSRGLYERAPSQLGMTPATYQRGGKGAQSTSVSQRVTWVFYSSRPQKRAFAPSAWAIQKKHWKRPCATSFPLRKCNTMKAALQERTQAILDFIARREPHINLPLDVQATAFQWRVWQVLRSINSGETRTYTQVAEAIGQPTSVRAVARACATNPLALVVPCHRVVRTDGSMAGYRWGLERKKTLLAQEKQSAKDR
jgi:AraC family transcriptional regulator of adaptative response/methylated-DNA-[protein]-cysteine methyltransferase